MKVSVLCATFRPAGIDILLAGMKDQTHKDFEVILVDRRYELRHDRVMRLAKYYNVNLIHVPEHRRNGDWISFCSGWNTAMALATGEILILVQDWAYCPAGWIEAHAEAVGDRRRYVLSPYVYTQMPEINFKKPVDLAGQMERGGYCITQDEMQSGEVLDEISCFKAGPFERTWLHKLPSLGYPDQDPRKAPRGPVPYPNWIHVKNESIRRDVAWELNGLDERLERGKGPMDTDWSNRLEGAGVELWWEPMGVSFSPNPRFIVRTMPWGDMEKRVEGRWSYRDGEEYCRLRKEEIANGGSPAAKNPYTMQELADRVSHWRYEHAHPAARDVSDLDYWGKELWPESE